MSLFIGSGEETQTTRVLFCFLTYMFGIYVRKYIFLSFQLHYIIFSKGQNEVTNIVPNDTRENVSESNPNQ